MLSKHQYVNAVALQMQDRDDWELILPVWGCKDNEPMKTHGVLSNDQTVVFNAQRDTESSAINEALKLARGENVVVIDPLTVLGIDFIPAVTNELMVNTNTLIVGVPVMLAKDDTPVREVGFNQESIGIEGLGFLYGIIVMVGKKTAYPKFEECDYAYYIHICRCIELLQADVKIINGNLTCAIQEYLSLNAEEEIKRCDSVISKAFYLGFSLPNTIDLMRLFSRRKALFVEFNKRYDPTLNMNEYINIFHRNPKDSIQRV